MPDTVVQSSYYVEGNKLIITRGKSGNVVDVTPSIENIKNKIQDLTYASSKIELVTVAKDPDAIDIDKIHNEIYKEPVNAYYTTNPYVVYPHENGVDFNISVDEAKAMLNEVKDEYEIPLKYTAPSVTTNMIGTEAFPDLLAKFSTNYNARDTDRTTNLRLAAEKINGTVLMPGETFSLFCFVNRYIKIYTIFMWIYHIWICIISINRFFVYLIMNFIYIYCIRVFRNCYKFYFATCIC